MGFLVDLPGHVAVLTSKFHYGEKCIPTAIQSEHQRGDNRSTARYHLQKDMSSHCPVDPAGMENGSYPFNFSL